MNDSISIVEPQQHISILLISEHTEADSPHIFGTCKHGRVPCRNAIKKKYVNPLIYHYPLQNKLIIIRIANTAILAKYICSYIFIICPETFIFVQNMFMYPLEIFPNLRTIPVESKPNFPIRSTVKLLL